VHLTSLGHAGWLIEAAGLRLLCDPLLEREHYRGVFEVTPPRRLRAELLRPDFILVSHAHPDHFDVPSLARLARLDPESVVITPDPLIVETARALGFVTVHQVPPGQRIELDGVTLVTTESVARDEWGVMIASEDGVIWNQVDSVFNGPEHVRRVKSAGLAAVGHERIDLALVMGRPMNEIAAQLGEAIGFPHADYAKLLRELAAMDPAVIVPASADTAHTEPFAWLNAIMYPVDPARFARDAARVCPRARVFEPVLGGRFALRRGEVELDERGGAELIEAIGPAIDRRYRPFSIPVLHDPAGQHELDARRAEVATWIGTELRAALLSNYPRFGVDAPLRFVVEAVFPGQTPGTGDAWTLTIEREHASVRMGADPDWDLYNLVAGTMLWEVITGRLSWGHVLISGAIRTAARAYAIDSRGLVPANIGQIFLYYALSYDDSVRRAVAWELSNRE
jgi:L-ascorbate metabolism protein UlaG (beta-lactamase superfamily)